MYPPRLLRPVLLSLVLLSAGLLLASCDYGGGIEGTVYEAPANGTISGIFVQTDTATVQGFSPLKDAEVTLEFPKQNQTTTDAKGGFSLGFVTGKKPEEVRFTVTKPGYKTATGKVSDNSHCLIFLQRTPEKSSE